MRAFVKLRKMLAAHKELAKRYVDSRLEMVELLLESKKKRARVKGRLDHLHMYVLYIRTILDDTIPGGLHKCTVVYNALFDRCDRKKDYEIAWAEVERRFKS